MEFDYVWIIGVGAMVFMLVITLIGIFIKPEIFEKLK